MQTSHSQCLFLSQIVSPAVLLSKCTKMSQSVAQVKGILICSAVKVSPEVNQSGMHFQSWRSQLAPFVLPIHTNLYSRSGLKQMKLGFPAIDHKKDTPTAYCSHLPLERHALSLSSLFSHTPIALTPCFSTHSHELLYPSVFLQALLSCVCLVFLACLSFTAAL